ncbi:hypothetical protein TWF106_006004 [Orbilia oligospora]|uniref:NAD-dependent epimerase/dehydratase domain-containing protein n=1 Tax=Orbilia oligospora TaxID=2813651 RepID=A0A6G1MGK5_ORBOL|nr:hypothetical protein TWF788_010578 [Orbilia oligospora]KAF3210746.1 hypothetical protein TWF191_011127 [Orbilia oligospora]KAF3215482.1 hypothetical protein TWF679_003999 [Orbilia oligospora]KAF3221719.1 hypothetical protein TWF106_006004 [Orbilia oligospora]KAF3255330.1 hypothetical protein TWF192_002686 [Orbilia oligospora]
MPPSYILTTGATGFIGAHVVSHLLSKGIRVRGTYRSQKKVDVIVSHFRTLYGDKVDTLLDFVYTGDLAAPGCFDEALKGGIDAVIHCASPLNFTLTPSEIINPAISGTKSLLASITATSSVQKLVVLSSFAAVVDEFNKGLGPDVEYTANDWNPITYEQGMSELRYSYLASKALSEKQVWEWKGKEEEGGRVGVVSLCPPLVFGPIAHPVEKISELNSSNAELWFLTTGFSPLPLSPVPAWVSIHDLTTALVNAAIDDSITNKRYTIASPQPFSSQLAADSFRELFEWAKERVTEGEPGKYPDVSKLEGDIAKKELLGGKEYVGWKETLLEAVGQFKKVEDAEKEKTK